MSLLVTLVAFAFVAIPTTFAIDDVSLSVGSQYSLFDAKTRWTIEK